MSKLEIIAQLEANAAHFSRKAARFAASRLTNVSDYYAGIDDPAILEPVLTEFSLEEIDRYVLPLLEHPKYEGWQEAIESMFSSEEFIQEMEARGIDQYRIGVVNIVGSVQERASQLHDYLKFFADQPLAERVLGRVIREEDEEGNVYEIIFEREAPCRFNKGMKQLWLRAYKNRGSDGSGGSTAIESCHYPGDLPTELSFPLFQDIHGQPARTIKFFDGKLSYNPERLVDLLEMMTSVTEARHERQLDGNYLFS